MQLRVRCSLYNLWLQGGRGVGQEDKGEGEVKDGVKVNTKDSHHVPE